MHAWFGWVVIFFICGLKLRASVVSELDREQANWRTTVLKQPLKITSEEMNKLREQVLADPLLTPELDPATSLRNQPAPEAIAALREMLRKPGAGNGLHRVLGDRLWEHYLVTGDLGAGREAVESWNRGAESPVADPARLLRLAGRYAAMGLWEAAVPALVRATRLSPAENSKELRMMAQVFRGKMREVELELDSIEKSALETELVNAALVAWEVGAKDRARRLIDRAARFPLVLGRFAPVLWRLQCEVSGIADEPIALRRSMLRGVGATLDLETKTQVADAIAGRLDKERIKLVEGAMAHLREGTQFVDSFDYLLAASCAERENRPADAAFIMSECSKRADSRYGIRSLYGVRDAVVRRDVATWTQMVERAGQDEMIQVVDVSLGALAQRGELATYTHFMEQVAGIVRDRVSIKSPANLGRIGLWFLLGGRQHEAAKFFAEGLEKSNQLEDRVALAFGLAVARKKDGNDEGALNALGGLRRDTTNALAKVLLVARLNSGWTGSSEDLLAMAARLARAEDREVEASRVVRLLQFDSQWRYLEEGGRFYSELRKYSNIPALVELARRAWPSLMFGSSEYLLARAVKDHPGEFEPFLKDLLELRAQTAPVLRFKMQVEDVLDYNSSGRAGRVSDWGQKLLWSVYDDAQALETVRLREKDALREPWKPGSLESGLWRHRFGEWDQIELLNGGLAHGTPAHAWIATIDQMQAQHLPDYDIPRSSVHSIQAKALRELGQRMDPNDANAKDDLSRQLLRRLDEANAPFIERLAMLQAVQWPVNELLAMVRSRLDGGDITLEEAASALSAAGRWGGSLEGKPGVIRQLHELQVSLAEWLLDRAGEWPESHRGFWHGLIGMHLPGSGPRAAENVKKLNQLPERAARIPVADVPETWIRELKQQADHLESLSRLESAVAQGTLLTPSQCKDLADLALAWLFVDANAAMFHQRTPDGIASQNGQGIFNPESASRALKLCSTVLAKRGWQQERHVMSMGNISGATAGDRWLPTAADALPNTRFLPPDFLLAAAREENLSPAGAVEPSQVPLAHEWRYQNLVRWLEERAPVQESPDAIPFQLLALQFRWTGGERRVAARKAAEWFASSSYPELRRLACEMLRRANLGSEAVALATILFDSDVVPSENATSELSQSLAKQSAESRKLTLAELAKRDAMKALLVSAVLARPAPAQKAAEKLAAPAPSARTPGSMLRDTATLVARDRRFVELIATDIKAACEMLRDAIEEFPDLSRGRGDLLAAPTEISLNRWARQVQDEHWLEWVARTFIAPASAKKSAVNARKNGILVPVEWRESDATACFLDLLRAAEPVPPGSPAWRAVPPVQTIRPPCWLRLTRAGDEGDKAIFEFAVSKDGGIWSTLSSVRWPRLGRETCLGVANFSEQSVNYSEWKFENFGESESASWRWSRGNATVGKAPAHRSDDAVKPLPPAGTLFDWKGGSFAEVGDAFYGLGHQVIGSGVMTVKLDAPPAGGRMGVLAQRDWFSGGTRIVATLDGQGRFEISQRLGRIDGVDLWKTLATKEASAGQSAWCMGRYLQALMDLGRVDDAWRMATDFSEKDLIRLLGGGCATILAAIHSAKPGQASAFTDRLLALGQTQSEESSLRYGIERALQILSPRLPAATDQDRSRKSAVDIICAGWMTDSSRGRTIAGRGPSFLLGNSSSQVMDAAACPLLPPEVALKLLTVAGKEFGSRDSYHAPASILDSWLLATTYQPDDGVNFAWVQGCQSLRGQPGVERALEVFPLEIGARISPLPEPAILNGIPASSRWLSRQLFSQVSLGLHLALGDRNAARDLSGSIDELTSIRMGVAPPLLRQILATCLHAGGFKDEALQIERDLFGEMSGNNVSCWDFSFDVPLRIALWSEDEIVRREALDQFVALVQRQKRAASYVPAFRLAVRKGAEMLRQLNNDLQAKELEKIADGDF